MPKKKIILHYLSYEALLQRNLEFFYDYFRLLLLASIVYIMNKEEAHAFACTKDAEITHITQTLYEVIQ